MSTKSIISVLLAILILDSLALGYLTFQYIQLKKENEYLKNQLYTYSQNQKNKNKEYILKNKDYENENLNTVKPPIDLKQFQDLQNLFNQGDTEDPFEEMRKMEEKMNKLFSQLNKNFEQNFEINVIPKSGNYFHFSNTQIINGKKFSYTIDVNNGKIKGKVIYDRTETLKQLEEKLKKLGLNTNLSGNTLEFRGSNVDINKVLQLFNINFEEKQITPENPNQNGIRRF